MFRRTRSTSEPQPLPVPSRLVEDDAALAELLAELDGVEIYAFDTEFHRERTYYPRLALVQLAWPGQVAVVDPLAVDPSPLAALFSSDALAVVHAGEQDLEIVARACGVVPRRLFDTQVAAGFIGLSSASLAAVVDRLLGRRLEKGDQLTDWMRRPLTPGQLSYAAGDVAYLLECYAALEERLSARGRWEWAVAECEEATARAGRAVEPEESWWRLRQARQLRGRARGVAQAVAAWRERRAQRLDVPVRNVLSDLAIVSIAQHPPRSRAELEQVRTLETRHLANGAAAELLEAIEAGVALAPGALRLPPGPQSEAVARPVVALAAAYATERARQLELDPAILATRADIVDFLQDVPTGRIARGWRRDLLGAELESLVEGKAALALDHNTLVLEERSGLPVTDGDLGRRLPAPASGPAGAAP